MPSSTSDVQEARDGAGTRASFPTRDKNAAGHGFQKLLFPVHRVFTRGWRVVNAQSGFSIHGSRTVKPGIGGSPKPQGTWDVETSPGPWQVAHGLEAGNAPQGLGPQAKGLFLHFCSYFLLGGASGQGRPGVVHSGGGSRGPGITAVGSQGLGSCP